MSASLKRNHFITIMTPLVLVVLNGIFNSSAIVLHRFPPPYWAMSDMGNEPTYDMIDYGQPMQPMMMNRKPGSGSSAVRGGNIPCAPAVRNWTLSAACKPRPEIVVLDTSQLGMPDSLYEPRAVELNRCSGVCPAMATSHSCLPTSREIVSIPVKEVSVSIICKASKHRPSCSF